MKNESRLNWTGSGWSLQTGGVTGLYIAHSMMTVINLLSALEMDGFAVSQVVLEGTSIKSVEVESCPMGQNYRATTLRNELEVMETKRRAEELIGHHFGSVSTRSVSQSREYHQASSIDSDGDGFQVDSVFQPVSLYRISPETERVLGISRSDTMTQNEDSLSRQEQDRQYTEWRF